MQIPHYIQEIIDEIAGQNRYSFIINSVLWVCFYTVLMVISLFLMRKLIIGVSRKIEYLLREQLYRTIVSLDYVFFLKNGTGDLTSRCTNDLNDVRTLLGPGIMYIPNSLTRFFLFFPVLLSLSPLLMLIITGLMAAIIVLIFLLMPRLRPMFREVQETVGHINNSVWQAISGITTLKLHTLEQIEYERFSGINQVYINKQLRITKFREFLWPFFTLLFSVAELLILLIGGTEVIHKRLSIGQLLQFNLLITYLMFPVLSLGWVMSLIQQGIAAMNRLNYILNRKTKEMYHNETTDTADPWLRLNNLSFRYPGREHDVLHDISLSIASGQIAGLTGQIGSGKSTLLHIIGGLLVPEPGMYFLDNTDIASLPAGFIFSHIAYVPQETFLFSKTIAENIGLSENREIDMEKVRFAAEMAGLTGEINRFPERYNQLIGERGINISGGQRQRVAIARALYKESPVLILDDSFSHVDSGIEEIILNNLLSLDWIKILIICSHRLSSLKNADMIYVLDNGSIAETGSHAKLLKNKGIYARIAAIQKLMEGDFKKGL
ncbi:MAG: ABC transporter ATP-binding protein [Spirochaetales bacterium]|nr:ABC transporter ATP-binding protein [Spirochaetales bacterium]